MREYEKLKNREKALKKMGFSNEVLGKSSSYRRIIKQFAKRMLDPDFKSQFSATKTSFFSNKPNPYGKENGSNSGKNINIEDEVEKLLSNINRNDNKGDLELTGDPSQDVIVLEKSKNLAGVSDQAVLSSVVAGVLATTVKVLVDTIDKYNIDISHVIDSRWLNNYIKSCEMLFSV